MNNSRRLMLVENSEKADSFIERHIPRKVVGVMGDCYIFFKYKKDEDTAEKAYKIKGVMEPYLEPVKLEEIDLRDQFNIAVSKMTNAEKSQLEGASG